MLQNYGFMHFSQTGTYQSNVLDIYAAQKFVISAKELDNVDKNFVLKVHLQFIITIITHLVD